jgi:hypothetical protein
MEEATRLFTKVFFALGGTWSDTLSFRRIVLGGVAEAQRQLFEKYVRWFDQYVNDPTNDAVFLDKDGFLQEVGGVAGFAERMTEQEIRAFEGSVDAASLVFMHSTLDGAAEDLCRVTAIVAPEWWYQFIEDQQERLGVFRKQGYEAVATDRINAVLDSLSHESLIRKLTRLFQVCRPDEGYSRKGYKFDEAQLRSLDRLRHDIVHRDRPRGPIPGATASIEFMFETGLYFFGMVNYRYGVKIDPRYRFVR